MPKPKWFFKINFSETKKLIRGGYKWFLGGSFFIGALWTYSEVWQTYIDNKDLEKKIKEIVVDIETKEYYEKKNGGPLSDESLKALKYKEKEMLKNVGVNENNIRIENKYKKKDE